MYSAALRERYPNDPATGVRPGDLRGAVSVSVPLGSGAAAPAAPGEGEDELDPRPHIRIERENQEAADRGVQRDAPILQLLQQLSPLQNRFSMILGTTDGSSPCR